MDWKPGDLALCIKNRRLDPFSVGEILIVKAYRGETASDWPGLRFVGLRRPPDGGWGWLASHFRKVPDHKADQFDHEIITAMNTREGVE